MATAEIINWIWLIVYFAVIYTVGYGMIRLAKIRKHSVCYWLIASWAIWLITFAIYRVFILTPDYLSHEASDLKLDIDLLWLKSLFFPVHHILLAISIIALISKKYAENMKFTLTCVYIFAVAICFAAKQYTIACIGIVPLAACLAWPFIDIASEKRKDKNRVKRLKKLRRNGTLLVVDLNRCEVKEYVSRSMHSRMDEPIILTPQTQSEAYNAVSGMLYPDIFHKSTEISTSVCYVSYMANIDGKQRTFQSQPIPMDKLSLEMLLTHQGSTGIYLNTTQEGPEYFFDLEFLTSE